MPGRWYQIASPASYGLSQPHENLTLPTDAINCRELSSIALHTRRTLSETFLKNAAT
jgi:hypothetical protein